MILSTKLHIPQTRRDNLVERAVTVLLKMLAQQSK